MEGELNLYRWKKVVHFTRLLFYSASLQAVLRETFEFVRQALNPCVVSCMSDKLDATLASLFEEDGPDLSGITFETLAERQ